MATRKWSRTDKPQKSTPQATPQRAAAAAVDLDDEPEEVEEVEEEEEGVEYDASPLSDSNSTAHFAPNDTNTRTNTRTNTPKPPKKEAWKPPANPLSKKEKRELLTAWAEKDAEITELQETLDGLLKERSELAGHIFDDFGPNQFRFNGTIYTPWRARNGFYLRKVANQQIQEL